MFFQNINYWAVVVSTVAAMAIGFLWYSPWALGAKWIKAKGITADSMKGKPMAVAWIATIVFAFVTSFVLAALFNSLVAVDTGGVILVAILVWLAFTVKVKQSDYTFGGESFTAIVISLSYELVAIVVMSLIIGLWR